MENGKLYNALLKTQSKQTPDDKKPAPTGEAVARQRNEPFIPTWTYTGVSGSAERAPAAFDGSASLELINNPNPLTVSQLKERKIIYPGMANKAILDAYREIRIKLRNKAGDDNFSVMVSSLSVKNTTIHSAFNLAASFALDAHSSALLVDCNPYSQELDRLVSVPLGQGITDFVADKDMTVQDIIYPSGIDRLSVIPAGHLATSAVELFSALRMKELMRELRDRYPDRYVVIHAPSFRISTEARILVRYADQAVLTVPFGEVTPEDVMASVEGLGFDKFSGLIYQE